MKLAARGIAAVLMTGAAVFGTAQAQADTGDVENVLTTLDGLAPGDAAALGQQLCPLLADRSQNSADIAAQVSDAIGRPLGVPTAFTGLAVSFLCPKAIENVANGISGGLTDGLGAANPLLSLLGG